MKTLEKKAQTQYTQVDVEVSSNFNNFDEV